MTPRPLQLEATGATPAPASSTEPVPGEAPDIQWKPVCEALLRLLLDEKIILEINSVLLNYQTEEVTMYEVGRVRYTLEKISVLQPYLDSKNNKEISVFLPSNLPIYSTFLNVILPALTSKSVTVRPNTLLIGQGVMESIFSILNLSKLLPNIKIFKGSRDSFREEHLSKADMIIFTGRNETRDEIKKCMKPNSYLINNGSGHNPIVVGADADLDQSIGAILYARFFNCGQDCAGPDAVFIHDDILEEFTTKISKQLGSFLTDENNNPVLTKFHRLDELQRLQGVIDKLKDKIITGGKVDMEAKLVHPTIILDHVKSCGTINLAEMFGPILFLYGYSSDDDLRLYFEDSRYIQNKMYVSLYGSSEYLEARDDEKLVRSSGSAKGGIGILLRNKIIHDIEVDNGTVAYGGYSKGGSSLLYKPPGNHGKFNSVALPILIPKILHQIFIRKVPIRGILSDSIDKELVTCSQAEKDAKLLKQTIALELLSLIKSSFGSNLNFGFAFGSLTEEKESATGISIFICTNAKNAEQYKQFTANLAAWRASHKFEAPQDPLISAEELQEMINRFHDKFSRENTERFLENLKSEQTYLEAFTIGILSEKAKFALVTRDKKFLHEMVDKAQEITEWMKKEVLNQLQEKRFPEMNNSGGHSDENLERLTCCEILRLMESKACTT